MKILRLKNVFRSRIIANYSHHPVYQYVYSYDGTFTTIDPFILPTWKYLIKLFTKVSSKNYITKK